MHIIWNLCLQYKSQFFKLDPIFYFDNSVKGTCSLDENNLVFWNGWFSPDIKYKMSQNDESPIKTGGHICIFDTE